MTLEFRKSPYEFYEEGCGCEGCLHGRVFARDPSVRCKLYYVDVQGAVERLKMDVCGTCLEHEVYRYDPQYITLVEQYMEGEKE